jgi:hypothetical protein
MISTSVRTKSNKQVREKDSLEISLSSLISRRRRYRICDDGQLPSALVGFAMLGAAAVAIEAAQRD